MKRAIKMTIAWLGIATLALAQQPMTPATFQVKAATLRLFNLGVNNPGWIEGRFEASGGPQDDIIVGLVTADEYENYMNGHTGAALYWSGPTTVGTMNVAVSPGAYVLLFENRNSRDNKIITSDIRFKR